MPVQVGYNDVVEKTVDESDIEPIRGKKALEDERPELERSPIDNALGIC